MLYKVNKKSKVLKGMTQALLNLNTYKDRKSICSHVFWLERRKYHQRMISGRKGMKVSLCVFVSNRNAVITDIVLPTCGVFDMLACHLRAFGKEI